MLYQTKHEVFNLLYIPIALIALIRATARRVGVAMLVICCIQDKRQDKGMRSMFEGLLGVDVGSRMFLCKGIHVVYE